jgi:hypothetical protein
MTTMVKRHSWADIKARTTPEVRGSIEAEARRLSEGVRADAKQRASTADPTADRRSAHNASDRGFDLD